MEVQDIQAYWDRLAYSKRDLTTCESEPLQFCGASQSHGVYLACDPNTRDVLAVSSNCQELLGLEPARALELNLLQILDLPENFHTRGSDSRRFMIGTRQFTARFNRGSTHLGVDVEEVLSDDHISFAQLYELLQSLDAHRSPEEISAIAVKEIRRVSGTDRVMVYRFEPNWSGQVIAESCREDLEPFLGLIYPASDIPAQARQIYLQSRSRVIADVQALPVSLLTRPGLIGSELDLTSSSLRACSPIHIQYLTNMGVRASLCFPLKVAGTLWGLISCHNYSQPLNLHPDSLSGCEVASQLIANRLGNCDTERISLVKQTIIELSQSLLAKVAAGTSAINAFRAMEREVLGLTKSTGAYIRLAGEECFLGDCPDREFVNELCSRLHAYQAVSVWSSQAVADELKMIRNESAVGVLAVPFSLAFEDLLVWFRPEHIHEVKWGGRPKPITQSRADLEPRASFGAWQETVKGRCREWTQSDQDAAQYLLFHFVQDLFNKAADLSRANAELQKLTVAKDEFISMISHELRTPLGVILGWIDMLRDFQMREPDLCEPLDILERNAKLQVNLINDLLDISRISSGKMRLNLENIGDAGWLIRDSIASLLPTADSKRIAIHCHGCEGIAITADPERLRQIVWNLVTNAIKFTPAGGAVTVTLKDRESAWELAVHDSGVGLAADQLSHIFERFAQVGDSGRRSGGLGLGLSIVQSLVALHGGEIHVQSPGDGLGSTFTVRMPLISLAQPILTAEPAPQVSPQSMLGCRILLAEDHPDAARSTAYILRRAGARVEVVHSGREALKQLQNNSFDMLLSDIGMANGDGYELIAGMRQLEQERGLPPLPAVALTAYAASSDRERVLAAGYSRHLAKPFDSNDLLLALASVRLSRLNPI